MRQGDYTIYFMDWDIFDIELTLTGKLKYIKYPNRTDIMVQISYIEPYVFFKPKPTLKWVNSDRIKINYNPLPIEETIVECLK